MRLSQWVKKWWERVRWKDVRWADIPDDDRDLCEKYGEAALQLLLSGAVGANTPAELVEIHNNPDKTRVNHIIAWLREQADRKEHREDRLEAIEWGIIVLIVLELFVAVYGIWLGSKEGKEQTAVLVKQTAVLNELQKSASATAQTLTSLAATMENMQQTQQRLLALNYEVSVNVGFNLNPRQVTIQNAGKSNVTLWGYKLWDQKPIFQKMPGIMTPGDLYFLSGDTIYNHLSQRLPKDQTAEIPFEVYLRNENGQDYIAKVVYVTEWNNGALVLLGTRLLSIMPERWSDKIAK
jgi:hypothetical protein